jgi:3-oxoacyl-[acyl-carrier-protein] synthase I
MAMTNTDAIAIIAAGAVTSVGGSAASTCAAIRSSLDNFKETHFIDEVGEPLLGAQVPNEPLGLADTADTTLQGNGAITGGTHKLAAMFALAATECVRAAGGIDAARTALLLIGPEASRPGFSMAGLRKCFDACIAAIGKPFHATSRITQIGSPGLAYALQYAQELLAASAQSEALPVQAVLISGIDSFLNTNDINAALTNERLLSSNNSDGFIPGEAAACLLAIRMDALAATDTQGRPRTQVLRVAGVGLAQEPNGLVSGKSNTGKGLAQAIRMALGQAHLQAHDIHHRLSDASGEEFFMDEATYAWGRVQRAPSPPGYVSLLTGASVGEIGAAAGPLLCALALDMARKQWGAGANTLIHLSNCDIPRGALVLQAV